MEGENAKALGGELGEHEKKIVSIFKEVDVVISTVAYPQFRDQLKIDDAIKVAGNIKFAVQSSVTFVHAYKYAHNAASGLAQGHKLSLGISHNDL
ncbi:hypothetical protein WN943_015277 [Citrus x changshan-huyou]